MSAQSLLYPNTPKDTETPENTGYHPVNEPVETAQPSEKKYFPRIKNAWFTYYNEHRNQVVCAFIGLLIASGFLIIGFFPTLLLAVFISIGVVYGRYKDGDQRTRSAIARIIDRLE